MKKMLMIAVAGVTIISQSVFARSIVGENYETTLKYQIQLQKSQMQQTILELDELVHQVEDHKKLVEVSTNYLATSSFMVGAGIMALIITDKVIDGGTYGMGKLVPSVISITVAGLGVIGTAGSGYALYVANKDLNSAYLKLRQVREKLFRENEKLLILEDSLETPN